MATEKSNTLPGHRESTGLETNQIHQGDCVRLIQQVAPGSVDLVFADPPFNIGYEYDVYDDSQKAEDYLDWCRDWISGVFRVLKPDGTFWLAIGDEYAAELKIEAQRAGFHCRSWVIWYYTFGVNCRNGFSRSHTHLFHFVKDPKKFTFNRMNPQVRVKSARQLVYADRRANPDGRLPDNTWITRPQDAPDSFGPMHDTWYFARVAGTFREREGFHGCQMPEQLLGRIVLSTSKPQDLVLDPFGGSGTTLCVAKKLARRWIGFELSEDYVRYIERRLGRIRVGDALEGSADPVERTVNTASGRRRKSPQSQKVDDAITDAFAECRDCSAMQIICDPELNRQFVADCQRFGGEAPAAFWNERLLRLIDAGELVDPEPTTDEISVQHVGIWSDACEAAWRLMTIDYRRTLDAILCSPGFASEFERLARQFAPECADADSKLLRQIAWQVRQSFARARERAASPDFDAWRSGEMVPERIGFASQGFASDSVPDAPGVVVLYAGDAPVFIGESENMCSGVEQLLAIPAWHATCPDAAGVVEVNEGADVRLTLKAAIASHARPPLNSSLLWSESELTS